MVVELNKSISERALHAIAFEVIANIIIVFFVAPLLNVTLLKMGMLSVTSSITAMIWNYIFNYFFDRSQERYHFTRNLLARIIHSVVFETVLVITLLPATMFILSMSITEALLVETGLVLFFLPYTLFFNLSYDRLRWFFFGD